MGSPEPRVSIVIPTYCSDRLDHVLASIDGLAFPPERLEVLLVDDGSPDGTPARLEQLAADRPGTRAILLEHSGWPSRPRNVGLEAARGDYVVFMDHDDELYPGGLAAAVELADRTGADVVTGKETRTDQPKWGLDIFVENLDDASERADGLHPLLPTNPHKLFRRSFLIDHGVRFPEGRRVLWEDVFFAIDLAAAGAHCALLSDEPFYHWVRHGTTASTSFTDDAGGWWSSLSRIFEALDDRLSPTGEDYRRLQWHQFRSRLVPALGAGLFTRDPAEIAVAQERAAAILARVPVELDDRLPRHLAARAHLARRGRWDLLRELTQVDRGLVGRTVAERIGWGKRGGLVLHARSTWTTDDGSPALRLVDGRVLRVLPPQVAAELPASMLDVTDDVAGVLTRVAVRSRDSAVTWAVPTETEVRVTDVDGRAEIQVAVTARLDRRRAALGHPLPDPVWDFSAHNELFGVVNHRPLRTRLPARVALVDGEARVAYKNASGILSLDLGQSTRTVLGSARLDPEKATTTHRLLRPDSFALPLGGVRVVGATRIDGEFALEGSQPAAIVADGDGARIEGTISATAGSYQLIGRFPDRDVTTSVVVTVGRDGRLTFRRESPR